MVRCGAGLDPDQARMQLLEERQDVATLQLAADQYFAFRIDEYRLRNIETDGCDRLHAPPNYGRFNSTHILGTRVPVEELST